MQVCLKCKKEMQCKKNGIILRWHKRHCYSGDLYECPKCGAEVIHSSSGSFTNTVGIPRAPQQIIEMED